MPLFVAKMLGQLRMACIDQCVVKGEGIVLAVIQNLGKLDKG